MDASQNLKLCSKFSKMWGKSRDDVSQPASERNLFRVRCDSIAGTFKISMIELAMYENEVLFADKKTLLIWRETYINEIFTLQNFPMRIYHGLRHIFTGQSIYYTALKFIDPLRSFHIGSVGLFLYTLRRNMIVSLRLTRRTSLNSTAGSQKIVLSNFQGGTWFLVRKRCLFVRTWKMACIFVIFEV